MIATPAIMTYDIRSLHTPIRHFFFTLEIIIIQDA